jgi:hypothetical protein
MELLLMNDRSAIEREIRPKTGAVAAEARCIPKQNSNDEGITQDLQIQGEKPHICRKRTADRMPTATCGSCGRSGQWRCD